MQTALRSPISLIAIIALVHDSHYCWGLAEHNKLSHLSCLSNQRQLIDVLDL